MKGFVRNKSKIHFKSLQTEDAYYGLSELGEKLTTTDKCWWKCQGGGRRENRVGFGLAGNSKCLKAMELCFTGIFIANDI